MNTILKMISKAFFCAAMAITLTSCFKRIHVTSNTYIDTKKIPHGFALGSSFCVILPQKDSSLLSKEIAFKIEAILKDKGYQIADIEKADYCVLFEHDVTRETDVRTVPVRIPGKTQVTTGSVCGRSGKRLGYQETTQSSDTLSYVKEQYTYYSKSLSVNVCNAAQYRYMKRDEVWSGAVVSSGDTADMREVLDYLFTAIFSHFGKDTKKIVNTSFNLDWHNKNVKNVRKSYVQ